MEYAARNPAVRRIRVSDYEPAFDAAIAVSRAEIDAIVNNPAKPTFNNTIVALDRQGRLLSRVEGIFFNLLEADATPEMQQVAENVQPKLTALSNDISLNPQLFERVKAVYEHPGWFLSKEDKKLLEETYNGFVRSGANLSDEDKELYRQYSTELSELSLRFSTMCWLPRMPLRSISRIRRRWPSFPISCGTVWPPKPRPVASRDGR